jgi:hypothetical protein
VLDPRRDEKFVFRTQFEKECIRRLVQIALAQGIVRVLAD